MSIEEKEDSTEKKPVKLRFWQYLTVVATIASVLLLLFLYRTVSGGLLAKYHVYNADYYIISMLFYVAMSWRTVPTGFAAGISTFGIPSWEMNAGWYFVPLFFCKLGMWPMKEEQEQFPADPELINKGPDTDPLREDEFRPIRTITGPGEPGSDDIMNARASPEWTFSVRWAINSESYFEINNRLNGDTWEEKHSSLRKTMRDTGEGLLTLESASRSPVDNIKELGIIDAKLKKALQAAFDRFDIIIIEVRLQSPDFGTGVSHALAQVIEERARAASVRVAAEAERDRQVLVSEGAKQATINTSEGDAAALANIGEGLKKKAGSLGMSGGELYTIDKLPDVYGDKAIIFGEAGMAQMVTGIKVVTDAISATDTKKKGDEK